MRIRQRAGQHRRCNGKGRFHTGAIGYISLDAVDDSVIALKLEGVVPSAETIKSGEYFLSRPFVMATKGEISEQNELVKALFDYVYSEEGQELAASVGLITVK